ncbi:MAG TPA: bifunctional UDP-N-acetylglucosamine diphosphorylase/glucosamine-1-phosphate N-acetyltransferase GlmU [Vicinamibacterales bacterium]|nr:bifunctional UDP-N-acetylglucosamine diphosphorylase/glucosamine-1-phosphate N-acetyltransferase GlmU [Vicinamibacterales bacterium]
MSDLHVVVLAAGKGTRMKSEVPKVLHRIAGRSLIEHVLQTAASLRPNTTTLVVGHGAEQVREQLAAQSHLRFVVQDPQLGTGHALLQTAPLLKGQSGSVLLLSGDVPLLRARTLESLVRVHVEAGALVTLLTAVVDRPYGYGRVVRSQDRITRIVEERDASRAQREIKEINSGIYALALQPLFGALEEIGSDNAQGEYYLPDLIGIYRRRRKVVAAYRIDNASEIRGINSRSELAEVSTMVRQQKNEELMAAGVTLIDPATTYIDVDVEVEADTVIHPCVFLEGSTKIGAACEIHAGSRIVNSTLGDKVVVRNHSVITDARIAAGASIGPFAHLRPGADVGADAHIGNFVELKKTTLGARSKANHLTYLGDATIGADVNVGAGTITCNYDGRVKSTTIVEDGAFIGSDTTIVAPVKIGERAYVGAGSTITENVPAGALAIARGRQENKDGWVKKREHDVQSAKSKAHGDKTSAAKGPEHV